MKKHLILVFAVLLIALMMVGSVQASKPQYFYLEKDCTDQTVTYCFLQNAYPDDLFDILEGGIVDYLGPVFANPQGKLSSEVILWSADYNSSVTGHFRWVGDHGYFTLRRGTGALEGLHAVGRIEWIEGYIFSLEGTYHFENK